VCNIVYAHRVAGLDEEQRRRFDEALYADPAAERELQRALMRLGMGDDDGPAV
jgi:uncharacterized protein (DUF1778 family)